MNSRKKLKSLTTLIAFYLISAGVSFFFFTSISKAQPSELISPTSSDGSPKTTNGFSNINPNEPKTEPCPINGELYTKTHLLAWEKRRPILTMIENHPDARPQSGLSYADIVYEAIAEGGITRFMGVYYCDASLSLGKVAPVRSARIYFVNIAAEYNQPFYVHVGGANCSAPDGSGVCTTNKKALAIEELGKLGWRKRGGNDFDTTADGSAPSLTRDYNRLGPDQNPATEHTMVGNLEKLWKEAEKRGFAATMTNGTSWISGFKSWKFDTQTQPDPNSKPANTVNLSFWEGYKDFDVIWNYDQKTGTYLRNMGGSPHVDFETKQTISAKNVITQFVTEEGPLDEHKHMFYSVIGEGKALYFTKGSVLEIKWKKLDQKSRTIYFDAKGKEMVMQPGKVWVEILPKTSKVTFS